MGLFDYIKRKLLGNSNSRGDPAHIFSNAENEVFEPRGNTFHVEAEQDIPIEINTPEKPPVFYPDKNFFSNPAPKEFASESSILNAKKIQPDSIQKMQAENLLKQARETAEIVNSTTNPRSFFGRLNFLLDVLLELQKYEKYNFFTDATPTKDYERIIRNLEAIVDEFIDRVIVAQSEKNESLTSQKEQDKKMKQCLDNLWNSFYEANDYWQGNNMYPHYTGKLYADENFARLEDILHDLELKVLDASIKKECNVSSSPEIISPAPCVISFHSSERFKKYEKACIEQFIEEDRQNSDRYAHFIKDLTLKQSKEHDIDLVFVTNYGGGCCSECAKNSGRVFSVSGTSKGFPKLPDYLQRHGNFHHGCRCQMGLYFDIDSATINFCGDILNAKEATRRPPVDNRTENQIEWHEHRYDEKIKEAKEYAAKEFDREEYETIRKTLPDIAPKSFSAYRRMKNGNTTGFQKILNAVQTVEK